MKISGKEAPQVWLYAMSARMKQGPFKARDLAEICRAHGVCETRGPDRMIATSKNRGLIALTAGVWTWVAGGPPDIWEAEDANKQCWGLAKDDMHETFQDFAYRCKNEEIPLKVGGVVYVGDRVTIQTRQLVDAGDVIEMIRDRADELIEDNDSYPDVTEAGKSELESFLAAWVTKHCPPDIWEVKDIREHILTEADIKDLT